MIETSQNFPTIVNSRLDSIDINDDQFMVLGSSSLSGRYWLGSLWYYSDVDGAPQECKSSAAVETNSGISDVKWISNRKMIAGLDSGYVSIWDINEKGDELHMQGQMEEHENGITVVSVTSDKQKAISGSKDTRIKIWDLENCTSTATYRAHCDAVWCVDGHPTQTNVFLSCSQDGRIFLWDTRNAKPAKVIGSSVQSIPTCITWHPTDEFALAVGTEDGSISVLDSRQDKIPPKTTHMHSRPVHRLQYSQTRSNWLASCSEDCTVTVIDASTEEMNFIYRDTRHTDFAQGLCWKPKTNKLYSSGWDFQVLCHDISSTVVNGHACKKNSMET